MASSRSDFNSYGSRRGNDRVMTRGTFANIRIRNQLAPGTEGGVTRHLPDGQLMTIYDAAMKYQGGRRAAGGAGRRRIRHRQQPRLGRQGNLSAGRPGRDRRRASSGSTAATWWAWACCRWSFPPGKTWESLGLTGEEVFDFPNWTTRCRPGCELTVAADGARRCGDRSSPRKVRIDTPVELDYYRNGGILQTVLRKLLKDA